MTASRKLNVGPDHYFKTVSSMEFCLLEGESFHSIVRPFTGVCNKSGRPLAEIRLAWDDDILGDYDLRRKSLGGWTHQVTRHSDGTYCMGDFGNTEAMVRNCHRQPECPKCHTYNNLVTLQESYLDRTICTANNAATGWKPCTYESVYMIGD